tara:strand:- start:731 stop:1075 length:345 start_codon:yes stop_codon:yes gene_type:complete
MNNIKELTPVKMYVSDTNSKPSDKNQIDLILGHYNGEYIGRNRNWEYVAPIIESQTEPMTDRDIFNALKKDDCWLKDEYDIECGHWHTSHKSDYKITYDGGKTWNELVKKVGEG